MITLCRFTVPGAAVAKPRMTRRDRWKRRPEVVRFRAWRDLVRLHANKAGINRMQGTPHGLYWTAYLPIPKSWPKRKGDLGGTFHYQRPDRDNIDKGIMDALFKEDSGIAPGAQVKRWDDGNGPRVEIIIKGG